MNSRQSDHDPNNTDVRMKLAANIKIDALATAPLVAAPTPMAPRPEFMP
jgi:hypothetical protein